MREDHRVDETDATREPSRSQKRHARENVHEEEQDGKLARIESPPDKEPVGNERLHDEPAGKRVDSEEGTELRDSPGGAMNTEKTPLAFDPRGFHLVRETQEDHEVEETDDGVEKKEGTVRVRAGKAERREGGDHPREKGAHGLGDVRDEGVDGEKPRPALGRRGLREDRLLDGEECAHL